VALRAGRYNANTPAWRGIIRDDGYPWYVCIHTDHDERTSRECAKKALPALKARDPEDAEAPLPEGWIIAQDQR
jgi:hypothetical protein